MYDKNSFLRLVDFHVRTIIDKNDLEGDYNLKNNSFFPVLRHNLFDYSFFDYNFPTYSLSLKRESDYNRLPNSIKKIEDQIFNSNSLKRLTIKDVVFLVGFFSIIKNNVFQVILCLDKHLLTKDFYDEVLKKDPITSKEYIQGIHLFINEDFVNNEDSKSLYRRLEKNVIPFLIENDVKVSIVNQNYIDRNVFNPQIELLTPLEKSSYIEGLIEEIKMETIEEKDIDIPF